jgi:transposase, IS5 family
VQGKMAKAQKSRASKSAYISPNQLELVGFESPFIKHLNPSNRWVILSRQIPWDKIANVYQKQLNNSVTGANGINPRVAIGAIFIKHICDLSDREAILQIQENVYMQYFIGYSGFSYEPVFDASLFVDLRKRFGAEQINEINELIMGLVTKEEAKNKESDGHQNNDIPDTDLHQLQQKTELPETTAGEQSSVEPLANKGELIGNPPAKYILFSPAGVNNFVV